jgi:hypothetical protein
MVFPSRLAASHPAAALLAVAPAGLRQAAPRRREDLPPQFCCPLRFCLSRRFLRLSWVIPSVLVPRPGIRFPFARGEGATGLVFQARRANRTPRLVLDRDWLSGSLDTPSSQRPFVLADLSFVALPKEHSDLQGSGFAVSFNIIVRGNTRSRPAAQGWGNLGRRSKRCARLAS